MLGPLAAAFRFLAKVFEMNFHRPVSISQPAAALAMVPQLALASADAEKAACPPPSSRVGALVAGPCTGMVHSGSRPAVGTLEWRTRLAKQK